MKIKYFFQLCILSFTISLIGVVYKYPIILIPVHHDYYIDVSNSMLDISNRYHMEMPTIWNEEYFYNTSLESIEDGLTKWVQTFRIDKSSQQAIVQGMYQVCEQAKVSIQLQNSLMAMQCIYTLCIVVNICCMMLYIQIKNINDKR